MKKTKIVLDIIMIVIMLLLMNLTTTGINIHEILGVIIFILFIIHKVLNFKWIKATSKNIFNKEIKIKTKIMYLTDLILLLLIFINVITGILISQCVLTDITVTNITLVTNIHKIISYVSLAVIVIHMAFHLDSIILKIKKILKKTSAFSIIDVIIKTAYTMVAVTIMYILIKNAILKNNNKEVQVNSSNQSIITKKEEDDSQTSNSDTNSTTVDSYENIEDYLGKLYCTGCGRHCPLTSPQCGRGLSNQTQKIQEYNETYNTNATYTSSSSTTNNRK